MRKALAKIPGKRSLRNFNVMQPGKEAIRQTLYDFTTYAAAGQTSLTFFQTPQGQNGKTLADTNMETAGSLPAGKNFLVESIQLYFFPGIEPTTEITTIAETEFSNDMYAVGKSGYLDLFVSSKSYLQEAPLMKFPPENALNIQASHSMEFKQAVAADAEKQVSTDYAYWDGPVYVLNPPVRLVPTQNFKVDLRWPTAVALPSGVDARIGVVLDGILYRNTQ